MSDKTSSPRSPQENHAESPMPSPGAQSGQGTSGQAPGATTSNRSALAETTEPTTGTLRRRRNGHIFDGGSSYNVGPLGFDPTTHESACAGLSRWIDDLRAAPRAPLPHLLPALLNGRHPLPSAPVRLVPVAQTATTQGTATQAPTVQPEASQGPAATTGSVSANGSSRTSKGKKRAKADDDEEANDEEDRANKKARKA